MNSVLIVEDEKAIADLIEMTLEPFAYGCTKAYDGETAADWIEKKSFDLILLDVMLPGVDGLHADGLYSTHRDAGNFPYSKGVLVEDRVRGLRAGAYDYIVKPFAPEELLARVEGADAPHRGAGKQTIHLWDIVITPDTRTVTKNGTVCKTHASGV